ncbi:YceI family protein [Streptomyces chiangmaiensis]|uniref:YceI family protein n=1 Tax=Streptomyces chiangmaiensis TaxID=766497 RepID=A0ABU7FX20_9ACTN|nr:YceI family protein [Streptomyces chiangmaiensis]MED7828511.1 YceI family protein [Streptomyces chiangmaiensis]
MSDGTYGFGPPTGRLLIKTSRAGVGRKAGHIEATQWSGNTVVVGNDPKKSSVTLTVQTGSLTVREGSGGLKPLTDANRAEIKKTLEGDTLLHTAKHPTITFRSTNITGTLQSFEITGDLTVKGQTHPVTVHGAGDGDGMVRGWATLTQSTWGIKPYTAFLGTLKLADEIRIEYQVTKLDPLAGRGGRRGHTA